MIFKYYQIYLHLFKFETLNLIIIDLLMMDRKSFEESGLIKIKGFKYDTSIELQKSLYMVDALRGMYDFRIETTGVTILKNLRNDNTQKITLDNLINDIQIRLHHEICEYFRNTDIPVGTAATGNYSINLGEFHPYKIIQSREQSGAAPMGKVEYNVRLFYHLFSTIDNINKAINNIIYLKESLEERCGQIEAEAGGKVVKLNGMDSGVVTEHRSIVDWVDDRIVVCEEFLTFDELYDDWEGYCDDEGIHQKQRPEKKEIKSILMKMQDKTDYGLTLGKNNSVGAPNGTKRRPKFNFKVIE